MYKSIALFALLVCLCQAKRIQFEDCGNSEIIWVDIEGCQKEPCIFKKGDSVRVNARFRANQNSRRGEVAVTVELPGGIEVEYPGIETNLCKLISCPIKQGQEYETTQSIATATSMPSMMTTLKVKATGDNGQLLCGSAKVGLE